MSRAPRHLIPSRGITVWSWLLALLVFNGAWGPLLARVSSRSGPACCAAPANMCCCVRAGLATCACDGQQGAAAQFASLSTCVGADDLPASLISLPGAMPAWPSEAPAAPLPVRPALPGTQALPPTAAPAPSPPPPQA